MAKSKDSGSSEPHSAGLISVETPADSTKAKSDKTKTGPWRVSKGVEVTSLRGLLKAGDEVSPRDFPGKMAVLQDLLSKGKLEAF